MRQILSLIEQNTRNLLAIMLSTQERFQCVLNEIFSEKTPLLLILSYRGMFAVTQMFKISIISDKLLNKLTYVSVRKIRSLLLILLFKLPGPEPL